MSGRCSNGHANAAGAQFCGTCGLAISDRPAIPKPTVPAAPAPSWQASPPSALSYAAAQAPYGTTGDAYAAPQTRVPARNGMGTAALVLGILGLLFALLVGFLGLILGILAIVFGSVGMARANRGQASNKTMAGWGLGLGIASVTLVAVSFLVLLAAL